MNPKVSVIIPVYNAEKYLSECLDSVLAQTLSEIEVICVDAGSTDRSPEILNEYTKVDSRLTVISGKGRLDAGTARNLGLEAAAGVYLSFLDADDIFKPEMLKSASEKMDAEQSDVLIFQAEELNMKTGIIREMPWSLRIHKCPRKRPFSPIEMKKHLFNSFENWPWNKLYRKSFILENSIVFQSIARTNDMAFVCQALAMARSISVLPETFVTYRVGTGTSLQQTNDRSPTCFWQAYKETQRRLKSCGIYDTFQQSFLNAVLSGCMYNLGSVKSDHAYQEIIHLMKSEKDVFGFINHKKSYYYVSDHYMLYLKLINGDAEQLTHFKEIIMNHSSGSLSPSTGTAFSFITRRISRTIACCRENGIYYTCIYALKRVYRTVFKK